MNNFQEKGALQMKIYIMRHGETKWNKRSKLQGQVDIPLAPKGIEQAEIILLSQ